jgi:hypothetical protein
MAESAAHPRHGFIARRGEPLIGAPTGPAADDGVLYFISEEEADEALSVDQASIQRALSLAGAWAELDTEDGPDPLDELDRMRHQSKPTPPLNL